MIESRIKVIAAQGQGQDPREVVLFECAVEEEEKAYAFARDMEALGVAVKINAPGVSETLASSLGVSEREWREYRDSMDREICDHEVEGEAKEQTTD
ncbi:MAG: hypothetical protein OXB88_05270 [Bacteriovoracales bacterium]|nr:hypothetical protein [Bacteriovoracales bacterium]